MKGSPDEKFLIVATATELKILKLRKNQRDNKLELVETDLSVPTDNNIISKIVQFKKCGRIFYGGINGHVNELNFDKPSPFDILSIISDERKKLKKNDH